MEQFRGAEHAPSEPSSVKSCPWCGGGMVFTRQYPVVHLAPGEMRRLRDDDIPEALRLVPAWLCGTPHCKYREGA